MKIQRFTKKPLTVEAMRIDTIDAAKEAARWVNVGTDAQRADVEINHQSVGDFVLMLTTREGRGILDGDYWIIKGPGGDFYGCEKDAFAQLYDPAEEQQSAATEGSA